MDDQTRIGRLSFVARDALRLADVLTRVIKDGIPLSENDPIDISFKGFTQVNQPLYDENCQTPEEHYQAMYRACLAEMIAKPEKTAQCIELLRVEMQDLIEGETA